MQIPDTDGVWILLPEWVLVDGDVPKPIEGSVMRGLGLRLSGVAWLSTDDYGIKELVTSDPARREYRITGVVEQSRDFQTDDGSGNQHAGCEILVVVEEQRVLVTTSGWARDFPPSAHITASGRWRVVAPYEWDDFELPDVRSDWLVRSIASAGRGDSMLDLVTLPSSAE
jgi:hypothetical protein